MFWVRMLMVRCNRLVVVSRLTVMLRMFMIFWWMNRLSCWLFMMFRMLVMGQNVRMNRFSMMFRRLMMFDRVISMIRLDDRFSMIF